MKLDGFIAQYVGRQALKQLKTSRSVWRGCAVIARRNILKPSEKASRKQSKPRKRSNSFLNANVNQQEKDASLKLMVDLRLIFSALIFAVLFRQQAKKTMPPNWLIRFPAGVFASIIFVFTFLFSAICINL